MDGPITTELSPFEEFSGVYACHEFLFGDEMVFSPVLFARARMTGRVGDGEAECICMVGEEGGEEGRFSGARRPTDDQGLIDSKKWRCLIERGQERVINEGWETSRGRSTRVAEGLCASSPGARRGD